MTAADKKANPEGAFIGSPLQKPDLVDVERASSASDDQDESESDDHLGRGDNQHEEHQHLALEVPLHTRERDEEQVHGVEHQFDEHEDNDCVASNPVSY